MSTKCYAMVRGSVARFTLLDSCGKPVEGDTSVVVTRGITTVAITENVETQNNDLLRNDETDRTRLLLRGKDRVIGYDADVTLCGVDPDLIWMLTGHPRVENAAGDVVGNDAVMRLPVASFAMEVWSKLDRPIDDYSYGYTLFPRMRGGVLSGFSFGNNAVTFTVNGARTSRLSKWGAGPYTLRQTEYGWDMIGWDTGPWDDTGGSLQCNAGEANSEWLTSSAGPNLHWRTMLLGWAPSAIDGAQPLYDAIDGGTASLTTDDVIDGEFVVTSPGIVEGGRA